MSNLTHLKYIKKYNINPPEAKFLGELERLTTLEVKNYKDNPWLHHDHVAFGEKDGHIISLGIGGIKFQRLLSLQQLPCLEYLKVEGCSLKTIKGLEYLENLRELYLSCNELMDVPGIQNLKNLVVLEIEFNPIEQFDGIRNLNNLTSIELTETNLSKHEINDINDHIENNKKRLKQEKQAIIQEAIQFKKQGNYVKVIKCYKKAIKLSKILSSLKEPYHRLLNIEDWINFASIYVEINKYEKALAACEQAIKLNNRHQEAQELRRKILSLLKV